MSTAAPPSTANVPSEGDVLPTREEAATLLKECVVTHTRVIRVTVDQAVLYVRGNPGREFPMTAWIEQERGQAAIRVQNGWPVQMNAGLAISPRVADIHDPYGTDADGA